MKLAGLPHCSWETVLFKTIFWVNYHIDSLKLCLPGDLNNDCVGFLLHSFICISNHSSTHCMTIVAATGWMSDTAIILNGYIHQNVCLYLPKYHQLQQLIYILMPNMCQKQIHPSNATSANYFMYMYDTILQSTGQPGGLLYIHFTLLAFASGCHVCCVSYSHPTALII